MPARRAASSSSSGSKARSTSRVATGRFSPCPTQEFDLAAEPLAAEAAEQPAEAAQRTATQRTAAEQPAQHTRQPGAAGSSGSALAQKTPEQAAQTAAAAAGRRRPGLSRGARLRPRVLHELVDKQRRRRKLHTGG